MSGGVRRTDPRLPGYLIAGFGAFLGAIVTGLPELAALGTPFVALAALGVVQREPPQVRGEVHLSEERAIEGDVVQGEVRLDWDGEAEVEVLLTDWRGVTPIDPTPVPGWSLRAGAGPATLPFKVRAQSWGQHALGTLRVRVRRPGGLLIREQTVATAPGLRVLPTPLRLSQLLKPVEPHAVSGMHLSRSRGNGTDFAELRAYRPGDRLRDLSWSTSARLGEPWVAVHHPERTGTVLIVLDAFFADDLQSTEALARAARAAWAVTSAHLRAQDRVGLLAYGRTAAWIPPRGGPRARWMLLDELLSVGGAAADEWGVRRHRGRVSVPADALVVGVTRLGSPSFTQALLHYRRTGHATAALVIDTSDLSEIESAVHAAADRLWRAQVDAERRALERGGVATAVLTGDTGVSSAIAALRRRMSPVRNPIRAGSTAS